MISVLATVRPDSWNLPLFVHVLGAMILVGGLLTGASAIAFARRDARFLRLGYWTLLLVALPGYIVMRIGAEWLYSKGFDDVDDEPTWLGIGYIVADLGLLIFVIALVLAGVASWKRHSGLGKAAGILGALLLVGMVVAVWAMGAKPD